MYEISEPLLRVRMFGRLSHRHVESPLPEERLTAGRHGAQVVHHHEHLDDGAVRVEQGDLQGALLRHVVALAAQVDVSL